VGVAADGAGEAEGADELESMKPKTAATSAPASADAMVYFPEIRAALMVTGSFLVRLQKGVNFCFIGPPSIYRQLLG
jgi:hypothetical protein